MNSLAFIKHNLLQLEEKNDACCLHREWEQDKENGELLTLLMQQMMIYIIDIDDGFTETKNTPQNNAECNRILFTGYLKETVEYGLLHCLGNKYFLWQMCFWCSCISTYYPLYACIQDPERKGKELLLTAHQKYPQSMLFRCIEEHLKGNWILYANLSAENKKLLEEEIALFDLQDNMADRIAKANMADA